jgi:hypothetical protein
MRQGSRLAARGADVLELHASKNAASPGNDSRCVGGAAGEGCQPAQGHRLHWREY